MPHADMAIGIDHVLTGENTVGDHEVAQQRFDVAHRIRRPGAARIAARVLDDPELSRKVLAYRRPDAPRRL